MFKKGEKPPIHKKQCKCFRCTGFPYNKGKKGHIAWNKGKTWDIKTREKISKTLLGNIPWNKGKKLSEEHRKNLVFSHLGIKQTPETIKKRTQATLKEKHWNWQKEPSYKAVHFWLKKNFKKPDHCEMIGCKYPRKNYDGRLMISPSRFEWSNKTGEYKRDINDWWQLCPSCHRKYDKDNKISMKKYART